MVPGDPPSQKRWHFDDLDDSDDFPSSYPSYPNLPKIRSRSLGWLGLIGIDWDMMDDPSSQNKTRTQRIQDHPGHWGDSPDPISSLPWPPPRRSSPVPSPAPGVARPCRAAERSCPRRSEGQSQEGPSRSSGSRHPPATNLANRVQAFLLGRSWASMAGL